MESIKDNKLVKECLRGNPHAFEELIRRYKKLVFNTVYRNVHRFEDAEDIAQTVFLKAYQNLGSFKYRYKFFSWLYRITMNEILNFHKAQRVSVPYEDVFPGGGISAEQSLIRDEESKRIRRSLLELTPDYRAVIELRHFHELSYSEIAGILEIPEKTVKSRLYTARQQLKELLSHAIERETYPASAPTS